MPFLEHQWKILHERENFEMLPLNPRYSWQTSSKGKEGGRVENCLLRTSKLRRIRMTYFDAGTGIQAFNSLCYPDYW